MDTRIKLNINTMLQTVTIFLISSFVIFESYWWGRYVLLGSTMIILLLTILREGGKYRLAIGAFPVMVALFAAYTAATSLWAIDPSDSIEKSRTLLEILFVMYIVYLAYRGQDVRLLLSAIKWTGFIVVLYSFSFYGVEELMLMAEAEKRMSNTYTNVNTIGMLAAVASLIQIDEALASKTWKWCLLFCVPNIAMVALTQSRKALVMLLAGCLMDVFFRNMHSKDFRKNIVKVIVSAVVAVALLLLVLSLPIFDGIMERMESLWAMFSDEGEVDGSAQLRNNLIKVGMEQFTRAPLFGVGIGNAHYIAMEHLGKNSYLHNNFVELLVGGGIVGFLAYYAMYICLFSRFWKYRKMQNAEFIICFILLFLLFCMDYGMVCYYSKIRYLYLLLFFLETESLKRHAVQIRKESEGLCRG